MARIVYVNGAYQSYAGACIHVEDRGFQFADSVYEVCQVRSGRLVDEQLHMQRLLRSMMELEMTVPDHLSCFGVIMRETVRRNRVTGGMVYLQVSRGSARRDFGFPPLDTRKTIVCYARSYPEANRAARAENGIRIITVPENRWPRVDIKTTGLLPNSLARQAARKTGADDAWFVDAGGYVTEGVASNAWIVRDDGTVCTRPAHDGILKGVTRDVVWTVLRANGYRFSETAFTPDDAMNAREAFSTAATQLITPVVAVNGVSVANGRPGVVTCELRKLLQNYTKLSQKHELLT